MARPERAVGRRRGLCSLRVMQQRYATAGYILLQTKAITGVWHMVAVTKRETVAGSLGLSTWLLCRNHRTICQLTAAGCVAQRWLGVGSWVPQHNPPANSPGTPLVALRTVRSAFGYDQGDVVVLFGAEILDFSNDGRKKILCTEIPSFSQGLDQAGFTKFLPRKIE